MEKGPHNRWLRRCLTFGAAQPYVKMPVQGIRIDAQGLPWGVDPGLFGTRSTSASPSSLICEMGVFHVALRLL